ncbi:MAG: helix-turn-helix transcriptional regulator [Anaerolineales bacterium]|nr:helix-turn-helix transcriptional regulator [Anaerolineales bacterium]
MTKIEDGSARFGELLRLYRRQSKDPLRGGSLTQERLGELLGQALGIPTGYSGAAISDWERGKSRIHQDDRRLLVSLVKVLYATGGLGSLAEADSLLWVGNYRALNPDEQRQVFSVGEKEGLPSSGRQLHMLIVLLTEYIIRPGQALRQAALDEGRGPPYWPNALLILMGRAFEGWSAERVLQALGWAAVWLLAWALVLPLLKWPYGSAQGAFLALRSYLIGALALPLFVGLLTRTRGDGFWERQELASEWALRFFTHLGACIGFNLGCVMLFGVALPLYYLGCWPLPRLLTGLAAAWPVMLAYAAARQAPFNQWRAFGRLRFADGAIFSVFFLFRPVWGVFLYSVHPQLLNPLVGLIVLLGPLTILAALTVWSRRRGYLAIPPYVWVALFGALLVLYQMSDNQTAFSIALTAALLLALVLGIAQGRCQMTFWGALGVLLVGPLLILALRLDPWTGRVLALLAVLFWALKGRQHLWLPPGFWVTAAAGSTCAWLLKKEFLSQSQAALVIGLAALAIALFQRRCKAA